MTEFFLPEKFLNHSKVFFIIIIFNIINLVAARISSLFKVIFIRVYQNYLMIKVYY